MDPPPIASTSSTTSSNPVQVSPPHPPPPSHHSNPKPDYSSYLLQPTNIHPSSLSGTQDLITLFQLDSLYNTFLRPYLPPNTTTTTTNAGGGGGVSTTTTTADSPIPPGVISIKGKEKASPVQSPAYAVASPAPTTGGGGFKITLGGIKLNASMSSSSLPTLNNLNQTGTGTTIGTGGKVKRIKMEKNYSHMIQDILGRNSIKKDQYLTHLVMNPDPPPCPSLVLPDSSLLRDGLTLKVGGLAGFDMSVWENSVGEEGGGGGERKKKKKRKQQQQQQDGTGGESDRKKQRQ
ncbi:hypothetical protein JCM3765_001547 [Sporobolomyces pararoseus]